VAETLRAALNELATVAPEWLRALASPAWFDRYKRLIEDAGLPKDKAEHNAYAQTVGEDGFRLLGRIGRPGGTCDAAGAADGRGAASDVATALRTVHRNRRGRRYERHSPATGEEWVCQHTAR
jgi:hypothetical protein